MTEILIRVIRIQVIVTVTAAEKNQSDVFVDVILTFN